MMSGNHAKERWYQPGALIYRKSDTVYTGAGNFTETTTGAWTVLSRALTMGAYTPPADVIALLTAQVSCSHSVANTVVSFSIRDSVAGTNIAATGIAPPLAAGYWRTWAGTGYVELTAGTPYTFQVYFNMGAATLTVFENADTTFLQMLVFKKP